MRLTTMARPPASDDIAAALTTAVRLLGQRPAVTALVPERREQGFASLAGWVAKGANLLQGELGLARGDRLALAGPPGWPLAAISLSAWWLGLTVVPATSSDPDHGPAVVVQHVDLLGRDAGDERAADRSVPRFVFGDALDGTGPLAPPHTLGSGVEQWTDAVTPHGDRPPAAVQDAEAVALVTADGVAHTQRMLLASLADDAGGVLGLLRDADEDVLQRPDAARRLAVVSLRPLVTGAGTVVVAADDAARDTHAAAERVTRWEP